MSIARNLGNWLPFVVVPQAIYSLLSLAIFGLAVSLWVIEYRRQRFHPRHVSHA